MFKSTGRLSGRVEGVGRRRVLRIMSRDASNGTVRVAVMAEIPGAIKVVDSSTPVTQPSVT
jgi:hypothetical protein